MKTALEQYKGFLLEERQKLLKQRYKLVNIPNRAIIQDRISQIDELMFNIEYYLQTEQDQLRAAYNNSCHDVSFEEWYNKKFNNEADKTAEA